MSKKVLLTGATGFLGSHLLESFISSGFEVSILKRSTSPTNRIDFLSNQYSSYNIDEQNLGEIFELVKPEIVVHTACSYGRKNETTFEVLETNLIFALELLRESEEQKVRTFINTDTLLPKNINDYSLSKAQFREWLEIKSKNIQVINLRLEHIYGPKDDDSKFIPWLLKKMLFEDSDIELTSGIQKRDFIYISDVVNIFILLIEKKSSLCNWVEFDVCLGSNSSLKDIVNTIAIEVEVMSNIKVSHRLKFGVIELRDNEEMFPKCDNSKILNLGWSPSINIKEGAQLLINYYNKV